MQSNNRRRIGGIASVALAALLAIAASACGGDSASEPPEFDTGPVVIGGEAKITPVFVSSEITVADGRVSIGLLDEQQQPLSDANLRFRFFSVEGDQGTLFAEMDALALKVTRSFTDTHTDGTIETHEVGDIGVYVARVDFPGPGDYGVQIIGQAGGQDIEPIQARFNVLAETPSIDVGERAPLTVQTILSDVANISVIDTSDPPDPDMHSQTIADAVTSGRPTVIALATPSFCTSRLCGPVKQTVDIIAEAYGDRANFIHVEPFDVEKARRGEGLEPVPFLFDEWGLTTEPWVYVIGHDGIVVARFEAALAEQELEDALRRALDATPSGTP